MTTDITELAQSLKAAAEKATPGPWGVARDSKTLVSNQSHPIATVSDAMHRMLADGSTGKDAEFIALANPANIRALVEALEKAQAINAAAEKLVRCKGRYHSEQNYRALAAMFGVTTPDLPPLEHENVHYAVTAEMEIAALRQRIAELDFIRTSADKVQREFADELGCAGDNESILQAIEDLKQLAGSRTLTAATADVLAERKRQVSVEGWTPSHDDSHKNNEMAFAAACYAFHAAAASWDLEDCGTEYDSHPAPKSWPWEPEWWKPKSARADLVRAGALILAEIERIDRADSIKWEAE